LAIKWWDLLRIKPQRKKKSPDRLEARGIDGIDEGGKVGNCDPEARGIDVIDEEGKVGNCESDRKR
jgi:hypothetical protein